MGNTIVIESQEQESSTSSDDQSAQSSTVGPLPDMELIAPARRLLKRTGSSFLDEPVTHKLTERGEASVTVGEDGNNGREGSEGENSRSSSGKSNKSSSSGDNKLRYAVSEMQGWRSHMEDKHVLNPAMSSNRQQVQLLKDHHLFAVFDGHGGDFASHYCGEHFLSTLTSQKDWLAYVDSFKNPTKRERESVTGLQLIKSALTSAFLELDIKLMSAQRKRRLEELSQLENMIFSINGVVDGDVFIKGSRDHQKIVNFDKQLPASMPAYIPLERSGSTGVVVLVTPHHFICANAGDSRAILSKKNEVLPLSFDHKPNNDVEVTRVEKDGGFVRAGRVDGDLAVSRSFGDFGYKNCKEKDELEKDELEDTSSWLSALGVGAGKSLGEPRRHRVTVNPDILVHTREPSKDEFVVLACDGIWDRMTNKDCSDLVRSLIQDEGETDVGLVCEEVIDTALELDSRDNMTCLLAVFPGASMKLHTDKTASYGGVKKRRYVREKSWGGDSTPAKRAQRRLEERRKKQREVIALHHAKIPKSQARRQRSQIGLQLSPSKQTGSPSASTSSSNSLAVPKSCSGLSVACSVSSKSVPSKMNVSSKSVAVTSIASKSAASTGKKHKASNPPTRNNGARPRKWHERS